jgi:aryl-alcohol dehydrogenase-like predicted oxidoreductase
VSSVIIGARTQQHLGLAFQALDVDLSHAEADAFTQLF